MTIRYLNSAEQSGTERQEGPTIHLEADDGNSYDGVATYELTSGGEYFNIVGAAAVYHLSGDPGSYTGYEAMPNIFDITVKTTLHYNDGSFYEYFRAYNYKVVNLDPIPPDFYQISVVEGTSEIIHSGTGQPNPLSFNLFKVGDGAGAATVTMTAGNDRFELVYLEGGDVEVRVIDPALMNAEDIYQSGASVDDQYFELAFSDGLHTVSRKYYYEVVNVPPGAPADGDSSADVVSEHAEGGASVGIKASAEDVNGGLRGYGLVDDFGLFDINATGIITLKADAQLNFEAAGSYKLEVFAIDQGGLQSEPSTFTILVGDENDAPVLDDLQGFTEQFDGSLRNTASIYEGQSTIIGRLGATDADRAPDADVLTYTITGKDAALFMIDSKTGELSFKAEPDFEAPGDSNGDNLYELVVHASDGMAADERDVIVEVENRDEAPVFVSGPVPKLELSSVEGTATTAVLHGFAAIDPDGEDVGYTVTSDTLDFLAFSIDAGGNLHFSFTQDYDDPQDSDGDNVYDIVVQATDGRNIVEQAVSLTITAAGNAAPVIEGPANLLVNSAENQTVAAFISASDRDGDKMDFSIVGGPDADLFKISTAGGTGRLSFVSAPDFENPGDVGRDNAYNVIVRVSDGQGGFDDQAIAVKVTDVDESGSAPVITSDGGGAKATISVQENATSVTRVVAADADAAATLSYSIAGGADKARFVIDAATGALSFVSAPDFEQPGDAGKNNIYDVTVQVSDGSMTDKQLLSIKIVDVVGKDRIGTSKGETLNGSAEGELLDGRGGKDTIKAEGGMDILIGGSGADDLYGGVDLRADMFSFARGETGKTPKSWDQVFDFVSGIDKIDLGTIDADKATGMQHLRFVSEFTKARGSQPDGQLQLVDDGKHMRIEIDYDGDNSADAVIQVMNVESLSRGDFIL